ncbi:uncharacterized protein C9orf40 homolog [Sceloporus undulatus]|uniref:uncharacterized protein C9orf40 homolog n=1 Tax=Sceloporus undulatus TaxID=8520 RepID=UPI001C4D7EB0|nr:uncharacterized protein C9orf40 homolog [Sceloporus undulatus]
MAKRRSEPLALGSSPCPRFLPPKRSRRELQPPWAARWLGGGGGGGGQKRKWEESMEPPGGGGGRRRSNNGDQEEEEEEVTVNCERPSSSSSAEESAKEEKGQALLCNASLTPEEGASKSISPAQKENEDDVWRYNSFQYWRSPLPTIHLSDILDLENNKAVDERETSSIGMSEMET